MNLQKGERWKIYGHNKNVFFLKMDKYLAVPFWSDAFLFFCLKRTMNLVGNGVRATMSTPTPLPHPLEFWS